jgi:hypothetical protein
VEVTTVHDTINMLLQQIIFSLFFKSNNGDGILDLKMKGLSFLACLLMLYFNNSLDEVEMLMPAH